MPYLTPEQHAELARAWTTLSTLNPYIPSAPAPDPEGIERLMLDYMAGTFPRSVAHTEQREQLTRQLAYEAGTLLSALYDATGTTDFEELQAWFDLRTGGHDARYSGVIVRLRAVLKELGYLQQRRPPCPRS